MGTKAEVSEQAEHVLGVCFAAKMRAANRVVMAIFDRHLAHENTTSAQTTVLLTVAANDTASISELAQAAGVDLSSMQRAVTTLETAGFVTVVSGHARTRLVSITPTGEDKLRAVMPHWSAAQAEVEERLGLKHGEFEHLGGLLDALKGLR